MYLNATLDAFWYESQGNHMGLITFLSIKGLSASVLHSRRYVFVDYEYYLTKYA